MPHKCTRCESIFVDGASVILSGCPNCGWNKFLYVKDEEVEKKSHEDSETTKTGEEHVIDETSYEHKEEMSSGEIIREIDDILGVEEKDSSVTEEEGERVESVRILGPGSYELNLDSLLDRKELVMAIKEDGAYALHLGSVFKENKDKKKKKK
ncbi:Zn-ribbon domain-containing protein [Methanolobus bombayensis]|uniref:Zn-ribbon domain-containing protein n=1 Tax=Methanolobus bombayensis TaxID=38023 RepID=UPI001AE2A8F9|nr:Zn-ribbon domain-containing protein [Methanolobus bombayensis]MBP1910358.1 putative nucleic acid-binding Zn-ribbon protein [Methanolobus bombayensis]